MSSNKHGIGVFGAEPIEDGIFMACVFLFYGWHLVLDTDTVENKKKRRLVGLLAAEILPTIDSFGLREERTVG